MKRNVRILRGARGMPGLSAYGLWLEQGNQGDVEQFFLSIAAHREILYIHSGGQYVPPGASVQLQHMAGRTKPGRYIVQYMINAYDGIFSLCVDGREAAHSRYCARNFVHGLCAVHIMQNNAAITIKNVSRQCVQLQGQNGCVDAYLWAKPID